MSSQTPASVTCSRVAAPTRPIIVRRLHRFGASMLIALALMLAATGFTTSRAQAAGSFIGPKYYDLGLGDSLAFGYQPNFDWSHGYVQQWYGNLRQHGSKSLINYGCNGEKTSTFINGGCPYAWLSHNYHSGSQLTAAVNFISAHRGSVSPVSLDMGANDVLPDINTSTCAVSSSWNSDLAAMDSNLSNAILPKLLDALKNKRGQVTGDLVMMNYYNPYAAQCPQDTAYVTELNAHLAADWTAGWQHAGFASAPYGLADVFSAFGGTATQNDCSLTWICSYYHDIHATGGQYQYGEPGNGYGTMSTAFERLTGY